MDHYTVFTMLIDFSDRCVGCRNELNVDRVSHVRVRSFVYNANCTDVFPAASNPTSRYVLYSSFSCT